MNFAQELFVLCIIGFITISTVMLNLSYATSSAKYSIDNVYPLTRSELIFVLAVYASRFVAVIGLAIFVAVCISHSMLVFWSWLGALTL
jgi:hypothetical protein